MANVDSNSDNLNCNKPDWILRQKAKNLRLNVYEEEFALALDQEDILAKFRDKFEYPKMKDLPCGKLKLIFFS